MLNLPLRQASHRGIDLDQNFVILDIQEKKQATVLVEEIENVDPSDDGMSYERPEGTISSQVAIFTQEPSPPPSPQQHDAVNENPPPYESYLIGVLDTPSPTPPLPPTPRLRPMIHPYIRSSGCHKKDTKRNNSFTAPGNIPLTPPASPSLPETQDIPRLSLKRARPRDSYEEETPARRFREITCRNTVYHPHPLDLTHLRHVWHHKRVYLVDPEEDGNAFECMDPHGSVWAEVEDELLVVRLKKKVLLWDERIKERWGVKRRCVVVGG